MYVLYIYTYNYVKVLYSILLGVDPGGVLDIPFFRLFLLSTSTNHRRCRHFNTGPKAGHTPICLRHIDLKLDPTISAPDYIRDTYGPGGGTGYHKGHKAIMLGLCYRLAPQIANLGGHPVQPPFKIPESIISF